MSASDPTLANMAQQNPAQQNPAQQPPQQYASLTPTSGNAPVGGSSPPDIVDYANQFPGGPEPDPTSSAWMHWMQQNFGTPGQPADPIGDMIRRQQLQHGVPAPVPQQGQYLPEGAVID